MRKLHPVRRVAVFTDNYPLLGPLVWILSLQYFVAQIVAAAAWHPAYDWARNFISDLGNTACGQYTDKFVCSPQHGLMNASFILLGVTMALGSLLIYTEFRESRATLIGFGMMGLAGIGTVFVGAFPENTIHGLHTGGAFLALGVGNLGLIILGLAIQQARHSFRLYTFLSGAVSLIAFALFLFGISLGLGTGTVERIASYPQTAWLVFFGLYMTATRYRARRAASKP
ncbi:MAG: DUF998 domain-containing protein [Candidatus Saccharimonadales bacterium]